MNLRNHWNKKIKTKNQNTIQIVFCLIDIHPPKHFFTSTSWIFFYCRLHHHNSPSCYFFSYWIPFFVFLSVHFFLYLVDLFFLLVIFFLSFCFYVLSSILKLSFRLIYSFFFLSSFYITTYISSTSYLTITLKFRNLVFLLSWTLGFPSNILF